MMGRSTDWLLALAGGALLAVMIDFNSLMAKHSTPVLASWIAHGIGSVAALALVLLGSQFFRRAKDGAARTKGPPWAYLGGVPGALTVVLAAIAVNSRLALSGTLALMLVGQVLFGIVCDRFGLFGIAKRKLVLTDFYVVVSILAGSALLIFFRS
ncbi:DMT family transporter [Pendulispora albinea]|uniref:DMT family transporter n=1 Tax=Pendulispora albinea TaxID=2741071 RepID=A0ABZ2M6J0_9BACT